MDFIREKDRASPGKGLIYQALAGCAFACGRNVLQRFAVCMNGSLSGTELTDAAVFPVPEEQAAVYRRQNRADYIGAGPGDVKADFGVGNKGDGNESIESSGDQGHPCPLALAVFKEPHGNAGEGKEGEGLVCPGKIAPEDAEAGGDELGPDQNAGHKDVNNGGKAKALAVCALVDVERVGNGKAQAAQSGIAGGDGQDYDAQQRNDAAHIAKQVLADNAYRARGKGRIRLLEPKIVDAHGARSPDHGDEVFKDHHVIESAAPFPLALHGAGDDRRLRGVEAGEDTAGHGHEKHRQEMALREISAVIKDAVVAPDGVPEFYKGISLGEDANKNADGGKQQDRAEHRVDPANDGIYGKYGGGKVVEEYDGVDHPGGCSRGLAGEAEHLRCRNVAGGVDEYGAHKQQKQAHKHVVYPVYPLVCVTLDHVRHLAPAVSQADHAGEIVVESAADDIADGDGNKSNGSEKNALDGS